MTNTTEIWKQMASLRVLREFYSREFRSSLTAKRELITRARAEEGWLQSKGSLKNDGKPTRGPNDSAERTRRRGADSNGDHVRTIVHAPE